MNRSLLLPFTALLATALAAAPPLRRTVCAQGCDFTSPQPAIQWAVAQQAALCQDVVLELAAGEVFEGVFLLPEKSCGRYIRLRSSRLGELPAGVRVHPSQAPLLAHLRLPAALGTDRVIQVNRGGYWAIEGLEISQPPNPLLNYGLIEIGQYAPTANRVSLLPHHIIIDRCYIHGQPQQIGPVRGIFVNALHVEIVNSYISEIKAQVDAQAIASLQSPGPLRIQNNFLEASGMSFLTGGGSPSGQSLIYVPGLAQRAGRFFGNHLSKKPEWLRTESELPPTGPCLPGSYHFQLAPANQWFVCATNGLWQTTSTGVASYSIKNNWELKDGQAYQLAGNLIENSWQQAQNGFGILLNQSGNRTRNYDITDVVIRGNRLRRVNTGFAMGNLNYLEPDGITLTRRVQVENNTFSLGDSFLRTAPQISRAFTVIESEDVRLARNTLHFAGYIHGVYSSGDYLPYPTLTGFHSIAENVLDSSDWPAAGLFGWWFIFNGGFASTCGVTSQMPRRDGVVVFTRNVAAGPGLTSQGDCPVSGLAPVFPPDHLLVPNLASVLNDPAQGDLRVRDGHPAQGAASDGGDLGADPAIVSTLSAQAASGQPVPAFDAGIRALKPTPSGALLRFTAPSIAPCQVEVSQEENFSSLTGSISQTRTGRAGQALLSALLPDQHYFVRVTCAGYRLQSGFRTQPPE